MKLTEWVGILGALVLLLGSLYGLLLPQFRANRAQVDALETLIEYQGARLDMIETGVGSIQDRLAAMDIKLATVDLRLATLERHAAIPPASLPAVDSIADSVVSIPTLAGTPSG